MDSIKEDIHQELRRLRLDKKHLYGTLLKIIDALPQEEPPAPVEAVETPVTVEAEKAPVPVEAEKAVETPVPVEKVEVVEKVEEVPPAKKSGGRKKTLTVKA